MSRRGEQNNTVLLSALELSECDG